MGVVKIVHPLTLTIRYILCHIGTVCYSFVFQDSDTVPYTMHTRTDQEMHRGCKSVLKVLETFDSSIIHWSQYFTYVPVRVYC